MKTISLRDTASATWCESARNLTFGNRTRAFLSCCLLGLGTLNVSALEPKTAHQMQAASTSLNALLPLSARAADTGQRLSGQAITTHIDALIDAANAMRRHARTGDRELRVLASSFGLAVERVQRSLASGDPAWSYFSLLALAEQCAACHTRLPVSDERNLRGPTDSDPSIQFLSPVDLATIHIATRRYRQAADTLEQYLLTHNTSTDRSRLMEAFVTYFDLMIAVHRNHERPGALIDELIATSPLPIYLRAHLRAWKRSLETLSPKAEASVA
nr:hypothetical protein [Gammaproteobacteria bacterium]